MDKKLDTLYDLCEAVSRELELCNEKIRQAGGKLTPGDVEYLDKLTHTMKSLKTTIAMMVAEDGGYSGRMAPMYHPGRSYADRDYSSAQRRDNAGRYARSDGMSRGGYSYDSGSEFMQAVQHGDQSQAWDAVDKLMGTLRDVNPRLYNDTMSKLR